MIHRFAIAATVALALACAGLSAPGHVPLARADEPVMKIQPTAGDSLSPAETKAINQTLTDYLEALRKKDYVRAGGLIDRASLLAQSEAMVKAMAPDSTRLDATRQQLFGVASRDSLAARSTGAMFDAFMHYMETSSPNAAGALDGATILVLAARRMGDTVHVAYQLTLPPTKVRPEPYTQVTAQQMKQVDGKWKILVTE